MRTLIQDTLLGVRRPRRPPISHCLMVGLLVGSVMTFYLAHGLLSATASPPPTIRGPILLPPTNRFKIAVFSDLYFGETSYGAEDDQSTLDLMRTVIAAEKPNLVVLNGDLLAGEKIAARARESAAQHLDLLFSPMVYAGIPWASTYGDHDSQPGLPSSSILEAEAKYNLSQTAQADPSLPGLTNYVLPIGRDEYGSPSVLLWFFDSRGGREHAPGRDNEDESMPGVVAPETASWFINTEAILARKHSRFVPSLGFVHIPPTRFLFAQKNLKSDRSPGMNFGVPAAVQSLRSTKPPAEVKYASGAGPDAGGHDGEAKGEGEDEDGKKNPGAPDLSFLTALRSSRGLHSLHAGHDRGNSWCAPWSGRANKRKPFLCFAQRTGYGGYGGEWNRGARILDLGFGGNLGRDVEVETWVRLDDGEVVDWVSLNGTYGADVYTDAEL